MIRELQDHIILAVFRCKASRTVVLVAKTVWLLRQHFEILRRQLICLLPRFSTFPGEVETKAK